MPKKKPNGHNSGGTAKQKRRKDVKRIKASLKYNLQ